MKRLRLPKWLRRRFVAETFTTQRIVLDHRTFLDCSFVKCELVFRGGIHRVEICGCDFTDCVWTFERAAANTLVFLKGMVLGARGFDELVLETIGIKSAKS